MIGTHPISGREIFEESQRILAEQLRCDFGISFLDDAILGMGPGDVTLIGARSGGGKTEFATHILLEQTRKAKSVLYFALDHDEGEIEKRIQWKLIVEQMWKCESHPLKGRPLRYAEWVAGRYGDQLREFEMDGASHLRHVLALADVRFLYRKGKLSAADVSKIIEGPSCSEFNLFIVDHFHAMPGLDRLDQQSEAIALISRAAENAGRPILLLGQFRKRSSTSQAPIPEMDEFSGSSQLIYLPQNIIVMAPRIPKDDSNMDKWETYFHVVKSRTASDAKGFVGVHSFDMERKKYSDLYYVMRHIPYGEPMDTERVPKWAKRIVMKTYRESQRYESSL